MPKEIRRLAFSHTEATRALNEYAQKKKVTLPQGKVLHARFASQGEETEDTMNFDHGNIFQTYNVEQSKNNVVITFYEEQTLEHKYCNVKADFVSAAMIEYCIANKVMLPKSGAKTIDITEFNICLDITMDIKVEAEDTVLSLEDDDDETANDF